MQKKEGEGVPLSAMHACPVDYQSNSQKGGRWPLLETGGRGLKEEETHPRSDDTHLAQCNPAERRRFFTMGIKKEKKKRKQEQNNYSLREQFSAPTLPRLTSKLQK